MVKREEARVNKEAGLRKPWTDDPVIQQYRFCNVRRMDDKVSKWLLRYWYPRSGKPADFVIAAALARLINWPDTLAFISGGKRFAGWDPKRTLNALDLYKSRGNKVFTGAYIINGARGGSKTKQVVDNIDTLAEDAIDIVVPYSMEETFENLQGYPGLGSFMAGQIVADLRWTKAMREPSDRLEWAPIGPGSRRGMRRLLGKPAQGSMTQKEFAPLLHNLVSHFADVQQRIFNDRQLEAMDVQNCLCEFDKYSRVLNGEGTPRSRYPGV